MRSWAVFDYPVQNALHTLKYRRNVGIGNAIAKQLAEFVKELEWDVELLVPVPLGKKRLKERGYNQVGLIAHPLSYEVGLQYKPKALWKSRETRSQVGLSILQRRENVQNAYQANPEIVKRKFFIGRRPLGRPCFMSTPLHGQLLHARPKQHQTGTHPRG
jgi:predicted amidophosphoribosyltransferase